MEYQLIDSDNYEAADIKTLFFPGGEPHAKVPRYDKPVLFVAKCRTWNDTGFAACVASALREQEAKVTMFVPYAPGARQDRSDGTAPLTSALMEALLVDDWTEAATFDLHSNKSTYHHHGWYNWMPSDLINPDLFKDVRAVIAPDAGATARAEDFHEHLCPEAEFIQCSKHRDPHTGQLSDYRFPAGKYGKGRYLVVDDICDGGGTFNLLAQAFCKQITYYTGQSLELFVSHGIFSKGIDNLSPMYSKIYTTDSWFDPHMGGNPLNGRYRDRLKRLTVFPLHPLYDEIMKEYCLC